MARASPDTDIEQIERPDIIRRELKKMKCEYHRQDRREQRRKISSTRAFSRECVRVGDCHETLNPQSNRIGDLSSVVARRNTLQRIMAELQPQHHTQTQPKRNPVPRTKNSSNTLWYGGTQSGKSHPVPPNMTLRLWCTAHNTY
ncbi:hypothetical protein CBL_14372 [Carabus blaptoides fortunei]